MPPDALPTTTERVWVCLGETDEWHPFCPFETRDRDEARAHKCEYDGFHHWCVAVDDPKVDA